MKKMIIGIVIGLFLGISTNAFAAIGDTVSAVFASFNYVVNGTAKSIDSPVLVYEGTSYVRTTDIANMLGFDVTYKSDSRTIEFNNPLSTPAPNPAPSTMPTTSPAPSSTPTDATVTPAPSTSPAPSASPAPTISPEPSTSPSPTPSVSPSPSPSPTNLVACQAIRDKYAVQISEADMGGGSSGQIRTKIYYLEYYRDQELAAAGCN